MSAINLDLAAFSSCPIFLWGYKTSIKPFGPQWPVFVHTACALFQDVPYFYWVINLDQAGWGIIPGFFGWGPIRGTALPSYLDLCNTACALFQDVPYFYGAINLDQAGWGV